VAFLDASQADWGLVYDNPYAKGIGFAGQGYYKPYEEV